MWLMTQHGFFSATLSPLEPSKIQLRARKKQHLRDIGFADDEIIVTPDADYKYRAVVTHSQFLDVLQELGSDIDYENFKGRVDALQADDYARSLHEVWAVMRRIQR